MIFRLCLLLALLQGASAFAPAFSSSHHQLTTTTSQSTTSTSLASSPDSSPATTADADASSSSSTSYVRCTQCQAAYTFDASQLGPRGGRRLECSVCSHSWFQSKDRILTLKPEFDLQPLPAQDLQRIHMNIAQGKSPRFVGDMKLYVGNIAFDCTEEELYEEFSKFGPVGDVSLVRDDTGRPKGFGFVTLREKADGRKALEELNGVEIKGREIMVRESTNN